LTAISIPQSLVKFEKKDIKEFTTYTFFITSKIKKPSEFFNMIQKITEQQLSIELKYPITFSKKDKFLEVKYVILMHQQNKKQVQLIN